MRERTPSADDTPKRAPPAPAREVAPVDVAGSKTTNGTIESFSTKFASPRIKNQTVPAICNLTRADSALTSTCGVDRMVASTHNLEDLGVGHPTNLPSDRQSQSQQQQEKHVHACRSAQTAQDKRSRLSNVINNLRKKVPETRRADPTGRKDEDERNSVERNLETLEKYVITVLNGVIKDEEESETKIDAKKEDESSKGEDLDMVVVEQQKEDSKESSRQQFEPSKPNESKTEAAVLPVEEADGTKEHDVVTQSQPEEGRVQHVLKEARRLQEDYGDFGNVEEKQADDSVVDSTEESHTSKPTGKVSKDKSFSKEFKMEDSPNTDSAKPETPGSVDQRKENRSLSSIIMDRLNEHQQDEKAARKDAKEESREATPENMELRNICRDLLNDLLNGINQLIEEKGESAKDSRILEDIEESRDSGKNQDFSTTSLHCSLPLDKVASVLQNCQSNELAAPLSPTSSSSVTPGLNKSPTAKPVSPTVRHLCLYCDRKFLSISLRQRHTERVHQLGGGRRSERNSRKPSQNCQYCSDKSMESLEGLFQHMAGTHGDRYYACVQCSTRYLTRDVLSAHMNESHCQQAPDKSKELSPCKDLSNQTLSSPTDRRSEEVHTDAEHRPETSLLLKPLMLSIKDTISNPGSPEFDSSFYSSVSCNIRENLLHHLDGKLQTTSSSASPTDTKSQPPQQQNFHESPTVSQIQFPIDISLTAVTPVYSKDYAQEEYENSSEYAQKPGKSSRSHPRRVSFEKYNFPRKYDGKEQWTCSIKDLSKFDISTQLSLRKKQQTLKEKLGLIRINDVNLVDSLQTIGRTNIERNVLTDDAVKEPTASGCGEARETVDESRCDLVKTGDSEVQPEGTEAEAAENQTVATEFSAEFGNFLRLKKWAESCNQAANSQEVVYAELTGEWSRPRIYICGACASKHVTLRELEDHKIISHPNVWCSHFEFSGDQRELYRHLFLPGRDVATAKAKSAILTEKNCTKCSKSCNSLAELHRHMLECGGDQAWLLGLFGNGRKKCKWRPFGSRSRRRRQRGMKRNIQNSQTQSRPTAPKERQPTGPRVRPSDRESIQKMLANLPPKRATRKVLQDSTMRAQGRLRNVQTRSRPRILSDNTPASRLSRNKAALRNKLLKNAKTFQRNRCRSDNISAVIESVVRNHDHEDASSIQGSSSDDSGKETKESTDSSVRPRQAESGEPQGKQKMVRDVKSVGRKKGPRRSGDGLEQNSEKVNGLKSKNRASLKSPDSKTDDAKSGRSSVKDKEMDAGSFDTKGAFSKNKSPVQTTPKKKRPVDPVASLNASIKAKSQLRTQDGKFAKNPNKDTSPSQKSPPVKGLRQIGRRATNNETSPDSFNRRSKLRVIPRMKSLDGLTPKRTTRLSSDSDKMPTLEPAIQTTTDELAETSSHDLPILSPVTSSSNNPDLKTRAKIASVAKCLDLDKAGLGTIKVGADSTTKGSVTESRLSQPQKEHKPGRGRPRNDAKLAARREMEKNLKKGGTEEGVVRVRGRKSAPAKLPGTVQKEEDRRNWTLLTRDRQRREEVAKSPETRSNAKSKGDRVFEPFDGDIKIDTVPFEVKKLIGSASKEDLFSKLSLTARDGSAKRTLRHFSHRSRTVLTKGRPPKDTETSTLGNLKSRRERLDLRRKSLRNNEKKSSAEKPTSNEPGKARETVPEPRTGLRGRRSSSLHSDVKNTEVGIDRAMSSDNIRSQKDYQNTFDTETSSRELESESSNNRRQTRASLHNPEPEVISKEVFDESDDTSMKKVTSLGKRRGRIKSSNEIDKKSNADSAVIKENEQSDSKNSTESNSKEDTSVSSVNVMKDSQESQSDTAEKDSEANEGLNASEVKETKGGKVEEDSAAAKVTELDKGLSHPRLETSNSVDSGKENSLETGVTVQRLKVGRPRKSWGTKKERTSKRSLNNVIGILTEGMNIPVESHSVLSSVQSNLETTNPEEGALVSPRESSELGLNCNKLSDVEKVEDGSKKLSGESETRIDKIESEINTVSEPVEENQAESSEDNLEKVNVDNQKPEVSSSKESAKPELPASNIILDLSRRKQKGKGSFLEKIVSKIAKQKDALLEGEVGCLLDTAADELTSILDEVGTGFPENLENSSSSGKSKDSSNEMRLTANQDITEKQLPLALENNPITLNASDNLSSGSVDEKTDLNKVTEEVMSKVTEINQTVPAKEPTVKGIPDSFPEGKILDENEKLRSKDSKLALTESKDNTLEKMEKVVDLKEDNSPLHVELSQKESDLQEHIVQSDVNEKEESCEEKLRRNSQKRSLGSESPTQNKKKSVEAPIREEENLLLEEKLAVILNLIENSKQVPFKNDNEAAVGKLEDTKNAEGGERILLGKRKNDGELEDSSPSLSTLEQEFESVDHSIKQDDDSGCNKKLKVDLDDDSSKLDLNGDDFKSIRKKQVDESVSITNNQAEENQTKVNSEENSSESTRAGKRKSSVELIDRSPKSDEVYEQVSKRRSLPENTASLPTESEAEEKISCAVEAGNSLSTLTELSEVVSSRKTNLELLQNDESLELGVSANRICDTDSSLKIVHKDLDTSVEPYPEGSAHSEQNVSVVQKTILRVPEISKIFESAARSLVSQENSKDSHDTAALSESKNLVVPKVPKKRGRKKKFPNSGPAIPSESSVSGKQTKRADTEETTKTQLTDKSNQSKETSDSLQMSSDCLENFKVPVILQHTKRRSSKRRSLAEDHSDDRATPENDPITLPLQDTKSSEAIEEDPESKQSQKEESESEKRTETLDQDHSEKLDKPGSPEPTNPGVTSKSKSSKKKQHSTEDISGALCSEQRAESVDNLSETSCTSESSYFRKKRLTRRRKGCDSVNDDPQTDTSITDSEFTEPRRTPDRRQSLKRKAKKNISFLYEDSDLMYDFDTRIDAQDYQDQRFDKPEEGNSGKFLSLAHQEPSTEPSSVSESIGDESDDLNDSSMTDQSSIQEVSLDEGAQGQEDSQTPKKRSTGNFVVVHTKTGEILIVEKRKKLTKEAAKFFCDTCATSFTRKSSLKKHNLSQSHLIQMTTTKSGTEKKSIVVNEDSLSEEVKDASNCAWNSESPKPSSKMEEEESSVEKSDLKEVSATGPDSEERLEDSKDEEEMTERSKEDIQASLESSPMTDAEATDQETLEDELLDEEICKITENMGHDEYVLVDEQSMDPSSTSTPVQPVTQKVEDLPKKRKGEKKREKTKKKNLADEHLALDTPEPEKLPQESNVTSSMEVSHDFDLADPLNNACLEERQESVQNAADSTNSSSAVKKQKKDSSRRNSDGASVESKMSSEMPISSPECFEKGKSIQERSRNEKERKRSLEVETHEGQLPVKLKRDGRIKETYPDADRASLKITISKRSLECNKPSDCKVSMHIDHAKDDEKESKKIFESETDEEFHLAKPDYRAEIITSLLPVNTTTLESGEVERSTDKLELESAKLKIKRKSKKHRNDADRSTGDSSLSVETMISRKSAKSTHNQSKRLTECSNEMSSSERSENDASFVGLELVENARIVEMSGDADEKDLTCATSTEQTENCTAALTLETFVEETLKTTQGSLQREEEVVPVANDKVVNREASESSSKCESVEPRLSTESKEASLSSLTEKSSSPLLSVESEKIEVPAESKENLDADHKDEENSPTELQKCTNNLNNDKLDLEENGESTEECLKHPADDNNQGYLGNESKDAVEEPSSIKKLCATVSEDFKDQSVEIQESQEKTELKIGSTTMKQSGSDRQISSKKGAKVQKQTEKEDRKKSKSSKSKANKNSRTKYMDLTSDSNDSDNEGRVESQNKSKIVKSVFGRVFGGEKTDKVKEVLNDWVSKSEDDSDASRLVYESNAQTEGNLTKMSEEKIRKRQTLPSGESGVPKKRGRKPKNSSVLPNENEEKNAAFESFEKKSQNRVGRPKNSSKIRRKNEPDAMNATEVEPQVAPSSRCRESKKRAEERISRAFVVDSPTLSENLNTERIQKDQKHKEIIQKSSAKSDVTAKDSGYGSFNYDEDPSKDTHFGSGSSVESEEKFDRRSNLSSSSKRVRKKTEESWSESEKPAKTVVITEEVVESLPLKEADPATEPPMEHMESPSRSSSILAVSSVRNRSPSPDRNSRSSRESEAEEEEDGDLERRRMSPLFARSTPDSSVESSENEEEEEEEDRPREGAPRKRSSSEFSGEKIVIRSPLSTDKSEVVTIAPTDAIEDNALDVPQEIETAKPRQGKVLNFDEELFVECCSRLKATTENELRGAKKIKLDHTEGYHRKDDQQQGFRSSKDRWRDVESQNSLGSLLESVNQLLGEEMHTTRDKRASGGSRNPRGEQSSGSASPDISRSENHGYEDSLDVAFEHNNKLRDKIQQRMRESENMIASTFGQKTNEVGGYRNYRKDEQQLHPARNSYESLADQSVPVCDVSNGEFGIGHARGGQEQAKIPVEGFKSKMNSALGGLLDKALSNLLHSNGKHDHNGSTPMKVLAELACARAPTSTSLDTPDFQDKPSVKSTITSKESVTEASVVIPTKDLQAKKPRNPIKELFERKKEMNERKQQEKSKCSVALKELNAHKQRKTKKAKKHQDFPLIRQGEHRGLVERKKRRDGLERKDDFACDRIKDVYEFDEDESQMEPNLGPVLSYRNRVDKNYEVSYIRAKDVDVDGLMSKAIGDTLENGKSGDTLGTRLESMIDRKFKEIEKFAPKTKGALKSFQSEDQQPPVTGPMDDFLERKQKSKRVEQGPKHSKLKKRSKNSKKKTRNAWYENDSSDEYRTAVKAEEVGVGITKSQRTCSKGKQNLFAELSTSSESEFDDDENGFETKKLRRMKKGSKKSSSVELQDMDQSQESTDKFFIAEEEEQGEEWRTVESKDDTPKNDYDNKKSESEFSDHPLVIDEKKHTDEHRNSDEETEIQYDRDYELDDLYREDSSVADSEAEELPVTIPESAQNYGVADQNGDKIANVQENKPKYSEEDELIPLEEALDLLDQAENLPNGYKSIEEATLVRQGNTISITVEPPDQTLSYDDQPEAKSPNLIEEQEQEPELEEEPDDDIPALPEKLSSNEKPQKESENLPLHVFLSRKVQESKKRKEQQLKKLQEEQERILMDFQPTRRQRKCAIGKQGLLAEISSSDEEVYSKDRKVVERPENDKSRKKRESKEKRKERYLEKKHEQMIAKEQKAIEEAILREIGKRKESVSQVSPDVKVNFDTTDEQDVSKQEEEDKSIEVQQQKKKHTPKEKSKKTLNESDEQLQLDYQSLSEFENENESAENPSIENNVEDGVSSESLAKKKSSKSPVKGKKVAKGEQRPPTSARKTKTPTSERSKSRGSSGISKEKERRTSNGKRDSDDEELKTTKSWNKVEEGVGVAIGRRKRTAANQLYYWSSSSDEEEMIEVAPTVEEEDDRQEQHGWIVGDSHKRMITMLAMEKQLKEKRRRSEDEFDPGRAKSKKHRNSTS